MPVKKRRGGTVTSVDLSDVQSGGAVPDGKYKAKIIEVEEKEGKESGEPYLQLTWEVTSDKCNGRTVRFDNYSLQPQALFRLKGLLESIGYEIADKGDTEIDWDEIIKDETECIIDVVVGEKGNDGAAYGRVTGTYALGDVKTVDDEEEDPKASRKTSRSGSSNKRDEDEKDERASRRGGRDKDDDDDDKSKDDDGKDERRSSGTKRLKKGATVRFKDERNKIREGEVTEIDGDKVSIETEDAVYEMSADELTVVI
jgi:hypothetical protein